MLEYVCPVVHVYALMPIKEHHVTVCMHLYHFPDGEWPVVNSAGLDLCGNFW